MRALLIFIDFIALLGVIGWGKIERVWRFEGGLVVFSLFLVFVAINLGYVLSTEPDRNAPHLRFLRRFRTAWGAASSKDPTTDS